MKNFDTPATGSDDTPAVQVETRVRTAELSYLELDDTPAVQVETRATELVHLEQTAKNGPKFTVEELSDITLYEKRKAGYEVLEQKTAEKITEDKVLLSKQQDAQKADAILISFTESPATTALFGGADAVIPETVVEAQLVEAYREEFASLSPEEKKTAGINLNKIGFNIDKLLNKGLSGMGRTVGKGFDKDSTMGRFFAGYSKVYDDKNENLDERMKQIGTGADKGVSYVVNRLTNVGYLTGNALKLGRIASGTAMTPIFAVAVAGTLVDAMKEARFENTDVKEKTRIQESDDAFDEAMAVLERAKKKSPDGEVTSEMLKKAYREEIPKDLLARLAESKESGVRTNVVQKVFEWMIKQDANGMQKEIEKIENDSSLSPVEIEQKKEGLLARFGRSKRLQDYDRMLSQQGLVDTMAASGMLVGAIGKGAMVGFMAQSVGMLFENLADAITSRTSEGAGTISNLSGLAVVPVEVEAINGAQSTVGAQLTMAAADLNSQGAISHGVRTAEQAALVQAADLNSQGVISYGVRTAEQAALVETANTAATPENITSTAAELEEDLKRGEANLKSVEQAALVQTANAAAEAQVMAEKLALLSTVKSGEGFWQVVERQLADKHPDWTDTQLNKETLRLLVKENIIRSDGSELRVGKVGAQITLEGDKILFKPNEMYTHSGTPAATPEEALASANKAIKGEVIDFSPNYTPPTESFIPESSTEHDVSQESMEYAGKREVYANIKLSEGVHALFGSKGFFGFGAQDGSDSISWKDKDVGFAHQTVDKVLSANPSSYREDGGRAFGIEDYNATSQMKTYLEKLTIASGVNPNNGENVAEYMKRAEGGLFDNSQTAIEATLAPKIAPVAPEVSTNVSSPVPHTEAPVSPAPVVEKIAGAPLNEISTEGGLKASFKYDGNGDITDMSMRGAYSGTGFKEVLNPNYTNSMKVSSAGLSFDKQMLETSARTVSMYKQLLETLEQGGNGTGQEATYLKGQIESIIKQTEVKYGDVFK